MRRQLTIYLLSALVLALAAGSTTAGNGAGPGEVANDKEPTPDPNSGNQAFQIVSLEGDQLRVRQYDSLPQEVKSTLESMAPTAEEFKQLHQQRQKVLIGVCEEERQRLRERLADQLRDRERIREHIRELRSLLPDHAELLEQAREETRGRRGD